MRDSEPTRSADYANGPKAPASTPRMPNCPRCGCPDFEVVRQGGQLVVVCESCRLVINRLEDRPTAGGR
jgi:hypothetical protein